MLLVHDHDTYLQAMEFINGNGMLAFDTETDGLNVRKSKVIGFGLSNGLDGVYIIIHQYNVATQKLERSDISLELVKHLLQVLLQKKLIMFNASFDINMTLYNFGIDLLPALHADAMLMKHTCDEEFPFGLKEIATKLWGADVKQEKEEMAASIKANGGKATEYFKASTATISKYCIQDCNLTFRIYNHYSKELRRQKLEDFYYTAEVLPLYKEVTIPLERQGVRLDLPLMKQAQADITAEILKTEQQIQAAIAPHLDLFTEWFLNKDYPLQTPKGKQPVWAKKHSTQYDAWQADYPDSYMFNLQSKYHLKKLFFDTLKLEPLSTTPTGMPQVDEEFLEHIAPQFDWVPKLIVYNKLNKIKSTYIDRFLQEAEGDRFYPSFMQHRTVSGRYGGDLQQLPRPLESSGETDVVARYTNLIRRFIIADEGCKLVGADYESLEPKVFCHASSDPALQSIFTSGLDFYSEVALRTENLQGVSSDKKAPNYLGKVNKPARQKAKAYALGIAYGMTGYKLQFEIGIDQAGADELVFKYLAAFPSLARFMASSQDEARIFGYVKSEAGRVRHMPRCKELFIQYGARLADSLHLWKSLRDDTARYAAAKADRKTYINLLNNAINFKIQSLAASIVNRAAIQINRAINAKGLKARLCMQVHDELVANVPDSELAEVCAIMKHEMESVFKLSVPLVAEPQIGTNYSETK